MQTVFTLIWLISQFYGPRRVIDVTSWEDYLIL